MQELQLRGAVRRMDAAQAKEGAAKGSALKAHRAEMVTKTRERRAAAFSAAVGRSEPFPKVRARPRPRRPWRTGRALPLRWRRQVARC